MNTKTCLSCGIEKPLDEFHTIGDRGDGYKARCKNCYNKDVFGKYTREKKDIKKKKALYARANKVLDKMVGS